MITVALGTSIPTSTTEVATSTSSFAGAERAHDAILFLAAHPAVQQFHPQIGKDRLLSRACSSTAALASLFSVSSTSG